MTNLNFTDSSKQALYALVAKILSSYLASPFKMDLLSGLKGRTSNLT